MKIKPLNDIEKSIEDYVVSTCGLTYSVLYTGLHSQGNWGFAGWKLTIRGQTFDYFTCLGHRDKSAKPQIPPIAGVLYSLILDGSACTESFASWCDNFGYATDSRKALKIYEQCLEGFDKLCKVFTTAQIEHITGLLENY